MTVFTWISGQTDFIVGEQSAGLPGLRDHFMFSLPNRARYTEEGVLFMVSLVRRGSALLIPCFRSLLFYAS